MSNQMYSPDSVSDDSFTVNSPSKLKPIIIGLLVLLVVGGAVALGVQQGWFQQSSAPDVVTDEEDVVVAERPQFFYMSTSQFDLSSEIASIQNSVADDVASFQTYQLAEPLPDDATPYLVDTVILASDVRYEDLYERSEFPYIGSLLAYMESDLLGITEQLTEEYRDDVLVPVQRSTDVTQFVTQEPFTFPPYQVTRAFVAAELLALKYPSLEESVRAQVEAFALASTGYGRHLESDIEASRALVNQYFLSFAQSSTAKDWLMKITGAEIQ